MINRASPATTEHERLWWDAGIFNTRITQFETDINGLIRICYHKIYVNQYHPLNPCAIKSENNIYRSKSEMSTTE